MSQEETLARLVSDGYLRTDKVIEAMRTIRREDFIPHQLHPYAWDDRPLPIGHSQTISAPHMYAIMLENAQVRPGERVLEIGAGSGYGAALLSFLVGKKGRVYSLELVHALAESARKNLAKEGFEATVIEADGRQGYAPAAPYDKIFVTAASESVPQPLLEQLKQGGRMLIPVGMHFQELLLVEKTPSGVKTKSILPVVFVPLVGHSER
ncbi:Protein-L-isoaspartate O-methyltransferase [uncultured archaeon]|nr:Protein-L-isoaspartate O-methyltransferase [uncultured archaeon]